MTCVDCRDSVVTCSAVRNSVSITVLNLAPGAEIASTEFLALTLSVCALRVVAIPEKLDTIPAKRAANGFAFVLSAAQNLAWGNRLEAGGASTSPTATSPKAESPTLIKF